jgi:hypothetical protein
MKQLLYLFLTVTMLAVSCKKDEVSLPDNLVNFGTSELGFDSDSNTQTVTLSLSRKASQATSVVLSLTATGVTYGTEFTTSPATVSGHISLTVPKDSTSVSFSIVKADNVYLSGSEMLTFSIDSVTSPVLTGTTSTLTVKFASIISSGSSMALNGGEGGSSAVNSVFVDLSNNTQNSVARASWNLGFYCGDGFRVILNNTTAACAVKLTKNDITQVTAADTAGVTLKISTTNAAMALIDDISGDLSGTVINEISTTDAENNVYIINPGTGGGTNQKDYKKIRILRSGTNYILQYANIADATYNTLTISKDDSYNYKFISFDNGDVSIEPTKAKWDLEWTGSIYKTSSGGVDVPYYFADLIFINHHNGTSAAQVSTSAISYDNFSDSNTDTLTFSTERNFIGSNWRASSGGTVGVKTDRFYVIKDSAGNIYKLKFLNFTSADGGTRGYPNIEYKLVKKG